MAKQVKTGQKTGSAKKTLWQFVKFSLVGMLASVVSFGTLNLLIYMPFIRELFAEPFKYFVFDYPVINDTAGKVLSGGLGYFIAFNTANILAQIVAFFVNREKTFKSSANIGVTLPIYIAFTLVLICFSAWLSPQINALVINRTFLGVLIGKGLAANIANMGISFVQFVVYFPLDKILFRKPKEA